MPSWIPRVTNSCSRTSLTRAFPLARLVCSTIGTRYSTRAAGRLTLTPTALQRDMRGRVFSVIGCIAIAVIPTVLLIVGEAVVPQMVAARLNELQHGPSAFEVPLYSQQTRAGRHTQFHGVRGYAHGTWGGVASVYRPHASRSTVWASFPVDSRGGHRVCALARGYYLAVHDARRHPLRAVCQTSLTVRCRESLTLLPVPCCRRNQRRRCRPLHRLLRGGALVERGARRAVPRRHLRLLLSDR